MDEGRALLRQQAETALASEASPADTTSAPLAFPALDHPCREIARLESYRGFVFGSLAAGMDLENRNQLLVRLTTQNLQEAITARKQKRAPRFDD